MPGVVKVKVMSARDLPIMDRSSELTDAFVELRLGENYQRTKVCPKTLNPVWDSPWFIFTVSDEDLQDEPLQIKLMDHDIYTAHDAIGKVYIRLNALTGPDVSGMDGWFPIFDTLHGVRGEVNLRVAVELVKDHHRLKQSSFGVMFFTCPQVPPSYSLQAIHGFVEELVVNDDPEYQWIDKIRTPRASNETRQRLFSKLSGELQRKIGVKTQDVGANAVIGYRQCFDLEGESGIVVRGIGTCVTLTHTSSHSEAIQLPPYLQLFDRDDPQLMLSPHRHGDASLSDSDGPPSPTKVTAMGESTSTSSTGLHPHALTAITLSSEFPFYTLSLLPPGTVMCVGGLVSAHSVKLLDKINNPDEPLTRDAWWHELRSEVRQHARALCCNAVIGYSETTSICDSLCVFSACGTAVHLSAQGLPCSPGADSRGQEREADDELCGPCHIPYSPTSLPFEGKLSKCAVCGSRPVPAVLLASCDVPVGLAVRGTGALIQTTAIRTKKKLKGDDNAQSVGQILPFLEFSLHEQLLHRLRLQGMNAVFRYRLLLNVGDSVIIGTAMGTGVYLEALPSSRLVVAGEAADSDVHQSVLTQAQRGFRDRFRLNHPTQGVSVPRPVSLGSEGAFEGGVRETLVVPVHDSTVKPEQCSDLLSDRPIPTGFHLSSTAEVPGLSHSLTDSRMVTMVTKTVSDLHRLNLSRFFHQLLQSLTFKVRHMIPCALTNITYDIDLPEDNELQVAVTAVVSRVMSQEHTLKKAHSDELIFTMDQAHTTGHAPSYPKPQTQEAGNVVHTSSLPTLPGYRVSQYLGIINLFLIRESTSVGEVSRANSFMHVFMLEALSIARAHVAALGGNALLSYRLSEVVFIEHPQKSQAQCLLNLSGDAALVRHESATPSPRHHALKAMQLIHPPDPTTQDQEPDPTTQDQEPRTEESQTQTKCRVTVL